MSFESSNVPEVGDLFHGLPSAEHDHFACLREALDRGRRGPSFDKDARARAARCVNYLEQGVGIRPGCSVAEAFVLAPSEWGRQDYLRDLFGCYVSAGHIRLNVCQGYSFELSLGKTGCTLLEAAIVWGNVSTVDACLHWSDRIPSAPGSGWLPQDGSSITSCDRLSDAGCRLPGRSEPSTSTIASALAQQEARDIARSMLHAIDIATACKGPSGSARRHRAAL